MSISQQPLSSASPGADQTELQRRLALLRRRWPILVVAMLLVAASAYTFSRTRPKEYSTSATLLFRDPGFDSQLFGTTIQPTNQDPARAAATNVGLVSLRVVADRTASALGQLTGEQVSRLVSASAQGQSDLVKVSATTRSPTFSSRLANAFAQQFILFRRESDQSVIGQAARLVKSQLAGLRHGTANTPQARLLADRAQQLQVLKSLQTGKSELVQPALVPTAPSSPQPARDGVLGAILGAMLGILGMGAAERLDRRIRRSEEIEAIYRRPILGTVPKSRAFTGASELVSLQRGEAEAFRLLRANLRYFSVSNEVRSVVVTSASPGDGKSTVAWHLAAVSATAGARILLIEADLRHPGLSRYYGPPVAVGLSQVLAGVLPMNEALTKVPLSQRANGASTPVTMDVLFAGPLPPNPDEILDSDRMTDLIRSSEEAYDQVIIDTTPTSILSDAVPLIKHVSGVIVVGRLGQTLRKLAEEQHKQLGHLEARILGLVVNGAEPGHGYGYGYGYSGGAGSGSGDGAGKAAASEAGNSSETGPKLAAQPPAPSRHGGEGEQHDGARLSWVRRLPGRARRSRW